MATFSFVRQKMGVRKPRLTSGEPRLRTNLSDLIGDITAIPGVGDVALTTNGVSPRRQCWRPRSEGLNVVRYPS